MFHPLTIESLFHPLFSFNELRYASEHQLRSNHQRCKPQSTAELKDNQDAYTLNINLPNLMGRRLDDIELSVKGSVLTLEVPALDLAHREGLTPLFEELPVSAQTKSYRLPREVEIEQIEAQFSGETLVVRLPKKQPTRVPVKISTGNTASI